MHSPPGSTRQQLFGPVGFVFGQVADEGDFGQALVLPIALAHEKPLGGLEKSISFLSSHCACRTGRVNGLQTVPSLAAPARQGRKEGKIHVRSGEMGGRIVRPESTHP